MADLHFDAVIVGGGIEGHVAALLLAEAGKSVLLTGLHDPALLPGRTGEMAAALMLGFSSPYAIAPELLNHPAVRRAGLVDDPLPGSTLFAGNGQISSLPFSCPFPEESEQLSSRRAETLEALEFHARDQEALALVLDHIAGHSLEELLSDPESLACLFPAFSRPALDRLASRIPCPLTVTHLLAEGLLHQPAGPLDCGSALFLPRPPVSPAGRQAGMLPGARRLRARMNWPHLQGTDWPEDQPRPSGPLALLHAVARAAEQAGATLLYEGLPVPRFGRNGAVTALRLPDGRLAGCGFLLSDLHPDLFRYSFTRDGQGGKTRRPDSGKTDRSPSDVSQKATIPASATLSCLEITLSRSPWDLIRIPPVTEADIAGPDGFHPVHGLMLFCDNAVGLQKARHEALDGEMTAPPAGISLVWSSRKDPDCWQGKFPHRLSGHIVHIPDHVTGPDGAVLEWSGERKQALLLETVQRLEQAFPGLPNMIRNIRLATPDLLVESRRGDQGKRVVFPPHFPAHSPLLEDLLRWTAHPADRTADASNIIEIPATGCGSVFLQGQAGIMAATDLIRRSGDTLA